MDAVAPASERVGAPEEAPAVAVAPPPAPRPGAPALPAADGIHLVTSHTGLEALAGAWDDLWRRSPSATPFQTHAWVSAWARAYVRDGRLAVVTVRADGRLVAAAPLHRVRRALVGVLTPLGGDLSDHTDLLLDPDVQDAGARLREALLQIGGWRVLDLPEVLPGAAAEAWAQTWPGAVRRADASPNLQLPTGEVADVLHRLPGRTAGTLRRKLRKIDDQEFERLELEPAAVARAVPDLIRLHADQWAGRRGNPEHLTGRFRAFLTDALPGMVERGQAIFVEYRLDGELVAAEVDLVGHRQLAYYLAGISPTLRERVDTAVLLVSSALGRAVRLGKAEYSFLRGDEDYKFRWRPDEVVAARLLFARPGLAGSAGYFPLTAARQNLLALARRMLHGRSRELARSVMHGVRRLRVRA